MALIVAERRAPCWSRRLRRSPRPTRTTSARSRSSRWRSLRPSTCCGSGRARPTRVTRGLARAPALRAQSDGARRPARHHARSTLSSSRSICASSARSGSSACSASSSWRATPASMRTLVDVLRAKREELLVTLFVVVVLLVFASSAMYYVEHEAQPDKFSSIPASMWWGVATLTTVGYGDIFPVTPTGANSSARSSPSSASASSRSPPASSPPASPRRYRSAADERALICPHCGRDIHEPRKEPETINKDGQDRQDEEMN